MRCNMSLKIHLLYLYIDFFEPNLGAVSNEHGERFHQDIKVMEIRYRDKQTVNKLADYSWTILRPNPYDTYKKS